MYQYKYIISNNSFQQIFSKHISVAYYSTASVKSIFCYHKLMQQTTEVASQKYGNIVIMYKNLLPTLKHNYQKHVSNSLPNNFNSALIQPTKFLYRSIIFTMDKQARKHKENLLWWIRWWGGGLMIAHGQGSRCPHRAAWCWGMCRWTPPCSSHRCLQAKKYVTHRSGKYKI